MPTKTYSLKLNFIYNSLYQILSILIPLITTPYLSRTIGAAGIGDYAYAYSIAYYFFIFIKLGLNSFGNRTIAYVRDDKNNLSATFWNIYAFQFIMAVFVTILYFMYISFFAKEKILSILLVFSVISGGIDITWFYWGLEEFRLTVTRDFIIKIITTSCIFILVKQPADTWKYTLILSLGLFVSQLLLWLPLKKYVYYKRPDWICVKKYIKPNIVLFIPTVAVSIYKTMDKIMLGMITSKNEVGFYESAEKVICVPLALISSLGTVMQPRMSNLVSTKANNDDLRIVFGKSISLVMFLSTSISFGIMLLADDFVPLFYGEGFEKCIYLFMLLLPSCIFLAFANVIRTQYLIPNKKDKQFIISLFIGAGVNLFTNMIFIPKLESIGAAIGTLMAEAAVCIAQIIIVRNEIDIKRYILNIIPYLASGIIMFIIGIIIKLPIQNVLLEMIFKILLSGIVFLLSLTIIDLLFKNKFEYVINLKYIGSKILVRKGKI